MTDVATVESSATAVPANQAPLTREIKEAWNRGEEYPQPKKDETPAVSDAPKAEESEPKGKSAAEPEAAPSQEKKHKKPGDKLSAEERIAQLSAKVKELEAERERSRAAETKPPAKVEEKAEEKPKEPPKRPNPFKWEGTPEEFEAAQEAYEKYLTEQAVAQAEQIRAQSEARKAWDERVKASKEKYADFDTTVLAASDAIAGDKNIPTAVKAMFANSPLAIDVLHVLGGDKATLDNFLQTARTDPYKAIRVMAIMEADIQTALAKKPDEPKPEKKTPAEPESRVTATPSIVGGRGSAPDNPTEAAVRQGGGKLTQSVKDAFRREALAGRH